MSQHDWRRLAHIREQQERMARLNLAAAAGTLREKLQAHEVVLEQTRNFAQAWERLLTDSVQGSHWAAMAGSASVQQHELRLADQNVKVAQRYMDQVGEQHRATVVDKEMAQTLVERQVAAEQRAAWARLQNLIDEHTAAARHHDREHNSPDIET
jgi:hypothetical protein